MEEERAGEVIESGVRRALDDGGLEAKGAVGNELELGSEVVEGVGGGADDAVFAVYEGEEAGELGVAEGVDLGEDMVVGHLVWAAE